MITLAQFILVAYTFFTTAQILHLSTELKTQIVIAFGALASGVVAFVLSKIKETFFRTREEELKEEIALLKLQKEKQELEKK